jgi:hypothetical protein
VRLFTTRFSLPASCGDLYICWDKICYDSSRVLFFAPVAWGVFCRSPFRKIMGVPWLHKDIWNIINSTNSKSLLSDNIISLLFFWNACCVSTGGSHKSTTNPHLSRWSGGSKQMIRKHLIPMPKCTPSSFWSRLYYNVQSTELTTAPSFPIAGRCVELQTNSVTNSCTHLFFASSERH